MKRILISLISLFIFAGTKAEIANPEPAQVLQPDGTMLTIQLHGDEFSSYTTTLDGYTVMKCEDNAYRYAVVKDGELVVTSIMAHDNAEREFSERQFCQSQPTHQQAPTTIETSKRLRAAERQQAKVVIDRSRFRGLVILVNYNDMKFTKTDSHKLFHEMLNKEDYTGYEDEDEGWQAYTGSLHDYFSDSSFGTFQPEFDVIGPVDINYSQYYPQRTKNAKTLIKAALTAANQYTDYTQYDGDGDGVVDMVYVIFAGYASSSTGNDERLMWPHASYLNSDAVVHDGMHFNRYACSTSLYGWNTNTRHDNVLCGIGTMCHEFSHVFGLHDHYDTDSNGTVVPATWDVMSSGNHNNKGRTPVAYNLYERTVLDMAVPTIIEDIGTYTLPELTTSNQGYVLHSGDPNETFYIENRQQKKWDSSMAGHGMLIWRVDSSDVKRWESNDVNTVPEHPLFELLRANPKWNSDHSKITDSKGDPFPGSANIREITNISNPSLVSWTGEECPLLIQNIIESNQEIQFDIRTEGANTIRESFSSITAFDKEESQWHESTNINWLFSNAAVEAVSGYGNISGHAAAIYKGGSISTETFTNGIESIYFNVANAGTLSAMVRLSYSTDQGATWTQVGTNKLISSKDEQKLSYSYINLPPESCIKISFTSGSSTAPVYVDNVSIVFNDEVNAIEAIRTKENAHDTILYNFGSHHIKLHEGKKVIVP